jgi:hypothetical protein
MQKMIDSSTCVICEIKTGIFIPINKIYYCISCIKKGNVKLTCSDCGIEFICCWGKSIYENYDICKLCKDSKIDILDKEFEYNTENILTLFQEFKEKQYDDENIYRLHETEILTDEKFVQLAAHLKKNMNSGYWYYTLIGLNRKSEFANPIMLNNNQVKILIDIVGINSDTFRYVHAMGSNTLLVEKAKTINKIFMYYLGKTKNEIFDTWGQKNRWSYNFEEFVIDECPICLCDIVSTKGYANCKYCKRATHVECKLNYFESIKIPKCELCRTEYSSVDDLDIIFLC